eukprot:scaffold6314_cov273-Ochromonas_danica.AAC.5
MILEISCGYFFGSLALIADGLHMTTHAVAFFIAAMSYSYARKQANSHHFVFGSSKVGELSSYTCALLLIIVAGYIFYEGLYRLFYPIPLDLKESLPVAFVGLIVNVLSAGILLGWCCGSSNGIFADGEVEMMMAHGHSHGHSHGHDSYSLLEGLDDLESGYVENGLHDDVVDDDHDHSHHIELSRHDHHHDHGHQHEHEHEHGHDHHEHGGHEHSEVHEVNTAYGKLTLSIYEDGIPPEFRIQFSLADHHPVEPTFAVTTFRGENRQAQTFRFYPSEEEPGLWRSVEEIPEPHSFDVELTMNVNHSIERFPLQFSEDDGDHHHDEHEHEHDDDFGHDHRDHTTKKYERDNNYHGALLHVVADAFVSVLAIIAIAIAGSVPQARFLDPLAGIVGALVIMSWGYQLACDSMIALLDLTPDQVLNTKMKRLIEADRQSLVSDLHVWKLGPGNLGVVMSVVTTVRGRTCEYYKKMLAKLKALAHITVEVNYAESRPHDH